MIPRCIGTVLFLAMAASPPSRAQDLAGLLQKARANMARNLKTQPNYVCLETIERSKRANAGRIFELVDVVRFEVAFTGGKELYSWPGSGRFGQNELWEMVPMDGVIGTGSFASHAHNLFVAEGPRFLDGARSAGLARYPFDVAQQESAYRIRSGRSGWASTGYHGSVLVDPDTAQVVKMDIVADEIPAELKLVEIHTILEYGPVTIGAHQYRLPVQASDIWIRSKGTELRNDSRFSSCREFVAESKLSFDDPSADPAQAPLVLPPGVEFQIEIVTPVDSQSAKAGDAIEAVLLTPIRQSATELLFESKARIDGRILRVQKLALTTEVELQFLTIADGAKQARFTAAPSAGSPPVTRSMVSNGKVALTRGPNGEGTAEITGLGERLVLQKGNRSMWRTTKVR